MSLLLRNACQDVLDDAGLQNFHCSVSERGNFLTIVGECGELFVSITGVQFARTAPSAAEIPLAVDLLESFLMKHKPDFDLYVKELKIFQALPVIKRHTDIYSIGISGYSEDKTWYCDIETGPYEIRIDENQEIDRIKLISRSGEYSLQDLILPNKRAIKAGYDHMIAYLAYLDAEVLVKVLKSKLSSCEI